MRAGRHDVHQVAPPATGDRIRRVREARGMSRPVLAGLVGRSTDWLKKIETGVRPLNSLALLVQLADVLGLDDVSALSGGELALPTRAWAGEAHHVVPEIRRALTESSFDARGGTTFCTSGADELGREVTRLWRLWHRSARQRSEVGVLLPELIRQAHASVRDAGGDDRRRCRAATGDLYRLVQRLLAHICEPELHAVAVERGRAFSEESDDPHALAEAAWSSSIGLCAAGHVDDAAALAERAAETMVRSRHGALTPAAMGTFGALQLEAAAAHALAGREGSAYHHLDTAAAAARRMPPGASHLPSAFDTVGVEIMGVIVASNLRRHGEAAAHAARIDLSASPSVVRRSRLLLEQADVASRRLELPEAVGHLDAAVQTSAEAVALIPWARTLADDLAESTSGTARSRAQRIAATMRAVG